MRASDSPARNAIEAVWRIEAARLIGGLVRFVRDVDRAEDLLLKLGRRAEAKVEKAASMATNVRERELLLERASRCVEKQQ